MSVAAETGAAGALAPHQTLTMSVGFVPGTFALFDDNYFDLNADSRRIRILRGKGTKFSVRSVYDIR